MEEENKETKEEQEEEQSTEAKEESSTSKSEKDNKKQVQNYLAAVIVLAGLFVGSLFVDVVQLTRGEGISLRKLNNADVVEVGDSTWVKKDEPVVKVTVLTDDDCENCQPELVLDVLKSSALPTAVIDKISTTSSEGQALLKEFGVKTIPAFFFDKKIEETAFFEQIEPALVKKDDMYLLDNTLAGIPAGKYIELPKFESDVIAKGNNDAPVKILVFSDFQCPYSKQFAATLAKLYPEYNDKAQVFFRQLPLSGLHPQAEGAALASLCANEQGKFWEMHDLLFANQETWGTAKDNTVFNQYANQLGLNANQFSQCVSGEKYKEVIEKDGEVANQFGITGTPGIFIGDQFFSGAIGEDDLKAAIDSKINQ